MNINNIAKLLLTVLFCLCVYPSTVLAGQGALLGIGGLQTFPKIDWTNGICNYDSNSGVLTVANGIAGLTVFGPLPAGPIGFVTGGLVNMTLNIDNAGNISGGSYTVNGTVTDTSGPTTYTDPLLSGSITDYGIVDLNPTPGATDQMDVRGFVTGGSMLGVFSGNDMGSTVTLESSSYSGTMTTDWLSARCKGVIGPVPPTGGDEGACSQGYWKNHPEDWPVNSLVLGSILYNQSQLLTLLQMKAKGDKSLILAKQLIAAKLNIAGGSDASCIQAVIDAADDWLDMYAPGGLPGNVNQWNGGDALKDDLDNYNNGGSSCAGFCTR